MRSHCLTTNNTPRTNHTPMMARRLASARLHPYAHISCAFRVPRCNLLNAKRFSSMLLSVRSAVNAPGNSMTVAQVWKNVRLHNAYKYDFWLHPILCRFTPAHVWQGRTELVKELTSPFFYLFKEASNPSSFLVCIEGIFFLKTHYIILMILKCVTFVFYLITPTVVWRQR